MRFPQPSLASHAGCQWVVDEARVLQKLTGSFKNQGGYFDMGCAIKVVGVMTCGSITGVFELRNEFDEGVINDQSR